MIRDMFDPKAIQYELFFCHHVFKFTHIKLGKSHFLEMWTFWWPGNLKLALEDLSLMLLVLQLGVDGLYDLAGVGPGHCALGLSKGITDTYLQPGLRVAGQS